MIDFSRNTRTVALAGTFTDSDLKIAIEVMEQITSSGKCSTFTSQPVIYVTERCVSQLTQGDLELIEVA